MNDLTLAELTKASEKMTASLNKEFKGERAWLERPFALAAMLHRAKALQSVDDPTYEDVTNAYLGLVLSAITEKAAVVEASLRENGFIQGNNRMEVGNDIYISAVEPREVGDVAARGLVIEGQERDFFLVLNRKGSRAWDLHIRRIWRDVNKAMQEQRCSDGFQHAGRSLTPQDIVRLAEEAMRYSDDIDDGRDPTRPSLLTHAKGTLIACSKGAGVGLKIGDFRDPGYVVSMKVCPFSQYPQVERGVRTQFGALEFVMTYLEYAAQCFGLPADPRIG